MSLDLGPLALGALAIWLVVLSIVTVLCVRQIALLTLRLEARGDSFSFGDDGLEVGSEIDQWVADVLPVLSVGRAYVLHVSASCGSCRDLIPALRDQKFDPPMVALLTGTGGVADELATQFPATWQLLTDPDAAQAAHLLGIHSTPFALQIERGVVTGKAHVKVVEDLLNLVESYDNSDAAEIAERVRPTVQAREGVVARVD